MSTGRGTARPDLQPPPCPRLFAEYPWFSFDTGPAASYIVPYQGCKHALTAVFHAEGVPYPKPAEKGLTRRRCAARAICEGPVAESTYLPYSTQHILFRIRLHPKLFFRKDIFTCLRISDK
jgi:hypothetical protein